MPEIQMEEKRGQNVCEKFDLLSQMIMFTMMLFMVGIAAAPSASIVGLFCLAFTVAVLYKYFGIQFEM